MWSWPRPMPTPSAGTRPGTAMPCWRVSRIAASSCSPASPTWVAGPTLSRPLATSGRVPPRHGAAVRRRRLLLPDVRDPPAARHDIRAGVARLRRLQAVRLRRAGPFVRSQRGLRQGRADPFELRPLPRSAARFAPIYAEAFGQPVERFTARLGIPRTDLFFDAERVERAVHDSSGPASAIPPGKRVILYAPTFRGERSGGHGTRTTSTWAGSARSSVATTSS